MTDKRPDPKPRKHITLWQFYLWWDELVQMRKKHLNRLSSIEAGKSKMSDDIEKEIIVGLDAEIEDKKKSMIEWGKAVGPIWDWGTAIKGLGAGSMLAQLLALFDDVGKYNTTSKFWRAGGQGLYQYWVNGNGKMMAPRFGYQARKAKKGEWVLDGVLCEPERPGAKPAVEDVTIRIPVTPVPEPGWELKWCADRRLPGWCSPYNNDIKTLCWNIQDSFIKQQTPGYVEIYYDEKIRQRKLHPEEVQVNGKKMFTDGHIHNRAKRKMIKIFLCHLWVNWRTFEGLPVTGPYAGDILGHTNIV